MNARGPLAIGTIVAVVAAMAGWREAQATPRVVAYDVPVAGWTGPPLRIAQLSDIHLGPPDMPATRVASIVAQVNALRPDLIVLTGDYHGGKLIDGKAGNLDNAIRPLARLRSRFGTFAVRGNHDEPYWSPRVLPRYGMTYLQNTHADAGPIIVAGSDDLTTGHADVAAALAGIAPGKPVIMLMHQPDGFAAVPASVALTLAGHTHGGQVRLPLFGAPVIGSRRGYQRGAYTEGGRRLIVSSGIGTTTLPIRWGVPPEIVVVTLRSYSTGRKSGTDR